MKELTPEENAECLATGSILMLLRDEKKIFRPDLVERVNKTLAQYNFPFVTDDAITKLIQDGLLIEIAGEIVQSEKGAAMFQKVADKIEVSEALGDNVIHYDADEQREINSKSEDLPAS